LSESPVLRKMIDGEEGYKTTRLLGDMYPSLLTSIE
jgi:hypothetical protein